jgi:hypothetical protein
MRAAFSTIIASSARFPPEPAQSRSRRVHAAVADVHALDDGVLERPAPHTEIPAVFHLRPILIRHAFFGPHLHIKVVSGRF